MTQEEKDLLLRDLCGRLPYGVILNCVGDIGEKLKIIDENGFINNDWDINEVKPYLRPLSSMTEEEKIEYTSYCFEQPFLQKGKAPTLGSVPMCIDWLNKKMFDFRGLIPKGRAIEAPKEMYKKGE